MATFSEFNTLRRLSLLNSPTQEYTKAACSLGTFKLRDIHDFIEEFGLEAFAEGYFFSWDTHLKSGYKVDDLRAYIAKKGIGQIDSFGC